MALPSASEVPTTSPSHGSTSGGHVKSYGAYRRKRYVLYPPRLQLHHPGGRRTPAPIRGDPSTPPLDQGHPSGADAGCRWARSGRKTEKKKWGHSLPPVFLNTPLCRKVDQRC